ncbi:MAG: hypothetical protein M3Y43_05045 [Pseudomonadota bacterium]|nr:hypothetical protein [Pseudomonadota bacterium]MDQ2704506.1 hypothetical protein [Pseudomonadota bacterium]
MRQGKDRTGIARLAAFVAALALVLQSALAVSAMPVQRDIFGNVICAEGSTGRSPSGHGSAGHDSGHMPDCCMLSCSAAFQTAADLPASTEWPAVALVGEAINHPSPVAASPRDRWTPANPRAPPAR